MVRFDNGGFGVVDFKTSARNSEHIPLYARQLHAYACALEQAAPGRLALSPVRRLGLLVYEPNAFEQQTTGAGRLSGTLSWLEIPRENGDSWTSSERSWRCWSNRRLPRAVPPAHGAPTAPPPGGRDFRRLPSAAEQVSRPWVNPSINNRGFPARSENCAGQVAHGDDSSRQGVRGGARFCSDGFLARRSPLR